MKKTAMSGDYSSEPKSALLKALKASLLLVASVACVTSAYGQKLIPALSAGGAMGLRKADLAVLESQEPRRDLQCGVTALRPELDYDFLFHTGYELRIPVRELGGDGNELTVLFRVAPEGRPEDASYMVQRIHVPALRDVSKGEGKVKGIFTVGEGKYHVDWMMRDKRDRICAMSWDFETTVNSKDIELRQWIPRSLIRPYGSLYASEPPVIRVPEKTLMRLSIILNFDSLNLDHSDPPDPLLDPNLYGLLAILRRIERDPRLEPYSIIICSLETQQVVYQQKNQSDIDLTALGEALRSVKLGTVDAKRLVATNGPAQFAADLIREKLGEENTDALIVLGPKAASATKVSRHALESFDNLGKPTFYLSYDTGREPSLWRDPISSIMKRLRGFEYSINRPKDFFNAWSDVVARIVRTRQAPRAATPPTTIAR